MEALLSVPILLTLFCMLLSARYQRLGDFVAGTMVVKQRAPRVSRRWKPSRLRRASCPNTSPRMPWPTSGGTFTK